MASTLELIDQKTGTLSAGKVVDGEITKLISGLYVYQTMLGPERGTEKDMIEGWRNSLAELRWYLSDHFQYKEKDQS